MATVAAPGFYVYVLARPNGKPFYVGKGQGNRIYNHESEARLGHTCLKCDVIRAIWKRGGQIQRYIIFTTSDENLAYAYEMIWISLFGLDTLCNTSGGGEQIRLARLPEDVRDHVLALAVPFNPIARQRRVAAIKAGSKRHKEGYQEQHKKGDGAVRISRYQREKYSHPEARAEQSAKMKAWWAERKAKKKAALAA